MRILNPNEYVQHCTSLCIEFIEGVQDDSIITGKYIKLQVERFVELKHSHEYEFRPEAVERIYRFLSYCYIPHNDKNTQFPMMPWQAFFIALIFGFYETHTGKRKHQEPLLFIARKNGKTYFAAALLLYAIMKDKVIDAQGLMLSITVKQANIALKYAKRIVANSPALLKRLKLKKQVIETKDVKDDSYATIFATDQPDSLEGFNPSFAIIDEFHGIMNALEIYQAIKTGIGQRSNPIIFIPTTAGNDNGSYLNERLKYYKEVLEGVKDNPRLCALIFQPDTWDSLSSEEAIMKANPGVGHNLELQEIKDKVNEAIESGNTMEQFKVLTRRLNVFMDEPIDHWIRPEKLRKHFKELNIDDYVDWDAYVGADLSMYKDMSALSLTFVHPDTKEIRVFVRYFISNETEIVRPDGFNLQPYIDDGLIHVSSTDVIDYESMIAQVVEWHERFNVVSLHYDRYNANSFVSRLQNEHGILTMPFSQTAGSMTIPMSKLPELMAQDDILFDDNPVLEWNFKNVVPKIDNLENLSLGKKVKKDSIDGVVAFMNALGGLIPTYFPVVEYDV